MPKAHVNGIDLYYKIHGQGAPLLLLSGFTADHLSFTLQLPDLAQITAPTLVWAGRFR
jgi:pimeloyl-ACP methyl ester carboxylesterase